MILVIYVVSLDYKYIYLKNIDINPKTFILRAQSQNIKDQLRFKTNDAYKKGIFGDHHHHHLIKFFHK